MCPESTVDNYMSQSHLIFYNDEGSIYQYLDIKMPYLILYEAVNIKSDHTIFQEYSENNNILGHNSYHNFSTRSQKLHYHNFYELTFVLSGTLNMQIEDDVITYHAGDCCLCNKNIHHAELMDEDTEIIIFSMKEEFIQDICKDNLYYDSNGIPHPLGTIFDKFFNENGKAPVSNAKIYANFRMQDSIFFESALEITNHMISEIVGTRSGKSYMMKALFCHFFEMLEDNRIYRQHICKAKLSHAEQIIYELLLAYQKKEGLFTRQEIEEITCYNSDHIERIVKKHTGKTLSDFGRSILLQRSAALLTETDMSISDICLKQGYTNRHYFNKIFIKQFGMTPSEYRKTTKK